MIRKCSAVRRRLAEYQDGELTIQQRVAVQDHLRECAACAAEADGLRTVGVVLRSAAARRAAVDATDLEGLAAGVVSRFRAEQEESIPRTVQRMFEDLHLVWAALGATAATFACLAITIGIFYLSRAEHPGSLANVLNAVATTGTDANPMMVDDSSMLPRQDLPRHDRDAVPELTSDEEIMLATTINSKGRVESMQLMNPDGPAGQRAAGDRKMVGQILDSVAQVRFEPARVGGEPVAVKMFWYLTHTTVRGKVSGEVHRGNADHVTHTA